MATFPLSAKAVFDEAVEIVSPDERRDYLERACAGAPALRQEVEALLSAYADAGSFLESPLAPPGDSMDLRPAAERAGTRIGPFKLLQQIGEGGMGVVWMAEQTQPVQRKVALKVIKPGMDSKQVVARFEAERQALAVMDHVNIARVIDGGATESGLPYFVMELVHGVPITRYCDDNHLTPRERLELFVPVCQAIQHAHQKGIIHRDIKPSNVMVTLYDGRPVPKVIDFGVAKATEQRLSDQTLFTQCGTLVGTLEYMSPEQAEMSALGVDTRSDIFSLGVLLYELLTGSTPLTHERMKAAAQAELLRMIKEEEPPKPSTRLTDSGEGLASISANRHTDPTRLKKLMRGDLDWILLKCLEKDRTRRYETANGLAVDILRHLNDEPVTAGAPGAGYKLGKFVKRNRAQVIAAGIVAGALLLGVVGTTTGMVWALAERDRANAETTKATLAAASEAAAKGKMAEVEPYLREALEISRRVLGDEHPDTLVSLNGMSLLLAGQGKRAEAEPYFRAAQELSRRHFKGDHPDVANSLANAADERMALGHAAEAEPLLVQALEMRQRLYQGDQPDVARSLDNLAKARQDMGRAAEAEPLLAQALEMRRRLYQGDHPDVATGLNNLANVRHVLGKVAEAEQLYVESLQMRQRLYAGDHEAVATGLRNLALTRQALGKTAEARHGLDQAVAMLRRCSPDGSPLLARFLWSSASARLDDKGGRDAAAALLELEEAVAMAQKFLPPEHPHLEKYRETLARCRAALAK